MPIYPGVATYQDIISSGVAAIGAWIRFAYGSLTEQQQYLAMRYPDATPETINRIAGFLELSNRAAVQLESGQGLPPLEAIPFDPSIPAYGQYKVDVVIKVPDPAHGGRMGGGRYRIDIPSDIAEEDILDYVYNYLAEQWQEGNCGDSPDLENCDEIDIADVNWQIVILGVTRG